MPARPHLSTSPIFRLAVALLLGLPMARAATNTLQFTQQAYTAFQTVGHATLTVARAGDISLPETLNYTLQDGSAKAGTDYDGTPGTVAFASGDVSKDITIPVTLHAGQAVASPAPVFTVTLSAPDAPWTLGATSQAVVTITNNDAFANAFLLPVTVATGETSQTTPFISGTIHGSTAGATVERDEPVHGQPASSSSVWYQWSAADPWAVPACLTCSQAYVQVYYCYAYDSTLGGLTRLGSTAYDASAGAWRCVFNPRAARRDSQAPPVFIYVCVSSPGATPGSFDLNWTSGSAISTYASQSTFEGRPLQAAITRSGDLSETATLIVTPVSYTPVSCAPPDCAAVAGVDFDATPQTVTFPPGSRTQPISIPTYTHAMHEATRTLSINIAFVQGNAMLDLNYQTPLYFIFNTIPFVPLAGQFQSVINFPSLFSYPYGVGPGYAPAYVTASVSAAPPHGAVTGRLTFGGASYPFTTAFGMEGNTGVAIHAGWQDVYLYITSSEGGQRLIFNLLAGNDTNFGYGDAEAVTPGFGGAKPAPGAGSYTAAIGSPGHTVGVVTGWVSPGGAVAMAGALADGTAFSFSSAVSLTPGTVTPTLRAPLYARIPEYYPHYDPFQHYVGSLSGDLQFSSSPVNHADLTASMTWASGNTYMGRATCSLAGQRYTPPKPGTRALPGLPADGSFTLSFSGPWSGDDFSHTAYWKPNNQVSTLQFENPRVFLSVNPATGMVSGSMLRVIPKLPSQPLRAVVLQGTAELQGLLIDTDSGPASYGIGHIEGR